MSLTKKILCTFLLLLLFTVVGFVFDEGPEGESTRGAQFLSLAAPTNFLPARIRIEPKVQIASWFDGLPPSVGAKYSEYKFSREWRRIQRTLTSRKLLQDTFATISDKDLARFAALKEGTPLTPGRKEGLFGLFCDSYWVRQTRGTALFEICFDHTNSTVAAEMANRICRQLSNQAAVKAEIIDLAAPGSRGLR